MSNHFRQYSECMKTLNGVHRFTCFLSSLGKVGALVYAKYMWSRRETLGLAEGASIPGWREVKQFLGAGGAMVFRQVNLAHAVKLRVKSLVIDLLLLPDVAKRRHPSSVDIDIPRGCSFPSWFWDNFVDWYF